MTMINVYGISNCDTVKKARHWLESHQLNYQFHDFRAEGLTPAQIKRWIAVLGLDTLVNKRSTTWKALDEITKTTFDEQTAPAVIAAHPTLIKRPLLETEHLTQVGFSDADYQTLFICQQ